MATKTTRTTMPEAGEHTDAKVKAFAEKWGYTVKDAERYLCQYAMNRLAVLRAYDEKKGKPEKSPRKAKAKAPSKGARAVGKRIAKGERDPISKAAA